ncbi:MAG: RHS repeat-associated core domain-containing protein [Verrucomicrobiota bacterium]
MIVDVELVSGKACKARKVAKADAFPTACKSAPSAKSADDNPTDAYDYQGRLIDKDDGTDVEVYVYDGWTEHGSAEMVQARPAPEGLRQRVPSGQRRNNRIASLDPQTSYLWGMDLSGSMQGAGGVGGLLKEGDLYPTYDANGNIMQKLDGSGTVVMNVDYDSYGNIISGTLVGEYGFSTKPLVEYIDWYYYGFRYYDPVTGRWPNRDPIGERGGLGVYHFVFNNPISIIDYLGMAGIIDNPTPDVPGVNPDDGTIHQGHFDATIGLGLQVGGSITSTITEQSCPSGSVYDYESEMEIEVYGFVGIGLGFKGNISFRGIDVGLNSSISGPRLERSQTFTLTRDCCGNLSAGSNIELISIDWLFNVSLGASVIVASADGNVNGSVQGGLYIQQTVSASSVSIELYSEGSASGNSGFELTAFGKSFARNRGVDDRSARKTFLSKNFSW